MITQKPPGAVVCDIKDVTGISGHRGRFQYFQSFDWFAWYCVTPPVYPVHVYRPNRVFYRERPRHDSPRPQLCIACGKVHVTSEICGREPAEPTLRDATVRRDDGYKLEQAYNMGALEE